jgi:peroxiredoxin
MALPCDIQAPDFTLTTTTGKSVALSDLLKRGPAVLAFFKISCPVCQYAFPFVERMWQVHKTEPVSFLGISQDSLSDTQSFIKQYGITFQVALDKSPAYIASNAYKLTNVPTIYLVDRDGDIQVSSVGWSRKDMEEMNLKLSMVNPAQEQLRVFKPGEEVAEFKAG